MTEPIEEVSAIYHDAGHAVVAVRVKVSFSEVPMTAVTPSPAPIHDVENTTIAKKISRQLFFAVGSAAELLMFSGAYERGSSQDRWDHKDLEELIGASRTDGWDQDVCRAGELFFRESRSTIFNALLRVRKLSNERVYQLPGIVYDELKLDEDD